MGVVVQQIFSRPSSGFTLTLCSNRILAGGEILNEGRGQIAETSQINACSLPRKRGECAPFLTSVDQFRVMKQGIHPESRAVVFQDTSSDFAILTRSTLKSRETIKWEDGNEYPLIKLEVSSASHPFYTGKQHVLQSARQVDKFRERYGK